MKRRRPLLSKGILFAALFAGFLLGQFLRGKKEVFVTRFEGLPPKRLQASELCKAFAPPVAKLSGADENMFGDGETELGQPCPRFVTVPFRREAGLGHRLANWEMTVAAALVLNVTPAMGDDIEACSWRHGCYSGAEQVLGLSLGMLTVSDVLAANPRFHVVQIELPHEVPDGAGWAPLLGALDARPHDECHVVYQLSERWVRDYSLARSALAQRFALAFSAQTPVYDPKRLAIAVHLRYGSGGSTLLALEAAKYKLVGEEWLRALLGDMLAALDTEAEGQEEVPYTVYVFTGGGVFSWLNNLPHVRILGKDEVSPAKVVYHMASADVSICGTSGLCVNALLGSSATLGFTARARESFDLSLCPAGIHCVDGSGRMTPEQRVAFLDTVDRWRVRRAHSCPPVWVN